MAHLANSTKHTGPREAHISKSRRGAAGLCLLTPFALLAGCRHQTQAAYTPAPPPIPARHATDSSIGIKPSAAVPMSPESVPSVGFDDTSGKPVTVEYGTASWYGPPYNHRAGADGTIFDQNAMTAAHRTLPMGTTVRVTNVKTGQTALVRITDRGPFAPDRVLDLSMGAAKAIGVYRAGLAEVKIEAFPHATRDPAGHWCVQIGAFAQQKDALRLKASLLERYPQARVLQFAGPTGFWVRITPSVPSHNSANEIARWIGTPAPAALPYVVRTD
jgi:rare lipoprotein A